MRLCSGRKSSIPTLAQTYVHLAARELASQAFRRMDTSTVHNLVWMFEEVRALNMKSAVLVNGVRYNFARWRYRLEQESSRV